MATADSDAPPSNHEAIHRYKEILLNRGIEGLCETLNEDRTIWESTKVSIAITGNAGTGKSTFINALLGLAGEKRAAAGLVETTKIIKSFCIEHCPNVYFYDLPGVGTNDFPKHSFVKDVSLEKYDFFIIIANRRFTENDIWIAENIKKQRKRFYFVRLHLHEDIDNHKLAHPSHEEDKVIEDIKQDCTENIKTFDEEIFLIDSFEKDKFDFHKLFNTLLRDSNRLTANALAICLAPITQEVLDIKFSTLLLRLFQEIRPRIAKDEVTAADIEQIMINEIAYYRKVFDIDEERLQTENLFNLPQSVKELIIENLHEESQELVTTNTFVVGMCSKIFKIMGKSTKAFEMSKATIDSLLSSLYLFHKKSFGTVPKCTDEFCNDTSCEPTLRPFSKERKKIHEQH